MCYIGDTRLIHRQWVLRTKDLPAPIVLQYSLNYLLDVHIDLQIDCQYLSITGNFHIIAEAGIHVSISQPVLRSYIAAEYARNFNSQCPTTRFGMCGKVVKSVIMLLPIYQMQSLFAVAL